MKPDTMRAAWYDRTGPAAEVLKLGDLPIPEPGPGEVRLRVIASGLNPTDVKSRVRPGSMPAPRVIPHQDGAGVMPERAQDEGAADVLRLCEAGRLLHVIGARFPLERIVQAREAQESGKVTGNIVVEVGKE